MSEELIRAIMLIMIIILCMIFYFIGYIDGLREE